MLKRLSLALLAIILAILLPPPIVVALLPIILLALIRCTYYWAELRSLARPVVLTARDLAPYLAITLSLALLSNILLGPGLPGLAAGAVLSYAIHRRRSARPILLELHAHVTNRELVKLALDADGPVCVYKGKALVYSKRNIKVEEYGRLAEGKFGVGKRVGKVLYARMVDLRRLSEDYVVCLWVGGPDKPPECCRKNYRYCRDYQYGTLKVATYTPGRKSPRYVSYTIVVPLVEALGVRLRDRY